MKKSKNKPFNILKFVSIVSITISIFFIISIFSDPLGRRQLMINRQEKSKLQKELKKLNSELEDLEKEIEDLQKKDFSIYEFQAKKRLNMMKKNSLEVLIVPFRKKGDDRI